MGRYTPQVTHRLTAPARSKDEKTTVSPDCGCPKVAEGLAAMPPLDVQLNSTAGAHKIGGGLEFGLTEDRRRRGWDVNSPYIVVQTDKGVMTDHNDIFNPTLIAFHSKQHHLAMCCVPIVSNVCIHNSPPFHGALTSEYSSM